MSERRSYKKRKCTVRYYNRNAKELPSLAEGDIVRIKPQAADGKHRWIKAQVEGQVNVRSYAVRTEDERLFRRNRKHLRTSKELFRPKDVQNRFSGCPPPQTNTEPALHQKPVEKESSNACPVVKFHQQVSPELHPVPPAPPVSVLVSHKNSAVTRSGRTIRFPGYLKDYV